MPNAGHSSENRKLRMDLAAKDVKDGEVDAICGEYRCAIGG